MYKNTRPLFQEGSFSHTFLPASSHTISLCRIIRPHTSSQRPFSATLLIIPLRPASPPPDARPAEQQPRLQPGRELPAVRARAGAIGEAQLLVVSGIEAWMRGDNATAEEHFHRAGERDARLEEATELSEGGREAAGNWAALG